MPKYSLEIPNHKQKGFDNQAEADPVTAKTIKKIVRGKLERKPHHCFHSCKTFI